MKIVVWFLSALRFGVWVTFVLYTMLKLSAMKAEIGHLQGALVALALMVAISSLAYNRSRAYKDGSHEQISSLVAGDLAFKAAVLFSVGIGLGSVLFLNLSEMGYLAANGLPTHIAPMLAAIVPTLFCGLAVFFFVDSLSALFSSLFPHWRLKDSDDR